MLVMNSRLTDGQKSRLLIFLIIFAKYIQNIYELEMFASLSEGIETLTFRSSVGGLVNAP